MIKRRIVILFLLVFSLEFTAQYSTTKGKNVKMSQQEMDRNAAEIVEILKFLDTDEVKQETIKAMKKDMKKTLEKEEGYVEKDVEGEVDREYKKRYGKLDLRTLRNSPKSEQKKVMDRIAMIQKELIQKKIKNKTMKYEFLTENLMLVKINNEWKVKG